MRLRYLTATRLALVLLTAAGVCAFAAPAAPAASTSTGVIPFKQVTAGMKGVGRSVFKGSNVEEFNVEILATMENILPKKSLIIAKLDGGPLRETGIIEGMSGSPIYLNGRLAGAVAYSWGFGKEPICGVTPIEEMLDLFERGTGSGTISGKPPGAAGPPAGRAGEPAPLSLLAYPDQMVSFLSQARPLSASPFSRVSLPASLTPLRPTLVFSGYSPDVARQWFSAFEAMSLRPVMGGSPGPLAAAAAASAPAPLTPGSAFGVNLVRGDLDVTAIGTVTYAEGDRVLGFGHPLLSMGSTAMPMTRAHVYGYFPSLASSFKLAAPLEEIGAITQDRFSGVAGLKGASVKMVPVRVEMTNPDGAARSYKFDIVPDPLLTPGLLNLSLLSLLSAEEKEVGDITLRLREGSRIQVSDGLDVKLDNLFSGDLSALYASGTVAYMTYLLLNNDDRPSTIEGVNLLFDYLDERRVARIEKIWLERQTATPGETLDLHVDLKPFRGDPTTVKVPLKIPEEAPQGKALLQVGDSLTLSRMEAVAGGASFVPRSLEHLVWLLNHIRANQKIYATLIRPDNGAFVSGERLPNLPPSISTVILQPRPDQDNSLRVRFRSLLEAEAETPHVVRGYQKAVVEIKR